MICLIPSINSCRLAILTREKYLVVEGKNYKVQTNKEGMALLAPEKLV